MAFGMAMPNGDHVHYGQLWTIVLCLPPKGFVQRQLQPGLLNPPLRYGMGSRLRCELLCFFEHSSVEAPASALNVLRFISSKILV
jgi:hypothetical protein